MNISTLGTRQKALALNLDARKYGTIAEIGGGQEVSRWFFKGWRLRNYCHDAPRLHRAALGHHADHGVLGLRRVRLGDGGIIVASGDQR